MWIFSIFDFVCIIFFFHLIANESRESLLINTEVALLGRPSSPCLSYRQLSVTLITELSALLPLLGDHLKLYIISTSSTTVTFRFVSTSDSPHLYIILHFPRHPHHSRCPPFPTLHYHTHSMSTRLPFRLHGSANKLNVQSSKTTVPTCSTSHLGNLSHLSTIFPKNKMLI